MKTRKKFTPIPKDIGDYISYSEESSTGLVWRVNRGSNLVKGKEAGRITEKGYFRFSFNGKEYFNTRVVYFLCTGIDPEEKQVDHEDTNRLNNKISNLRLATNKQNQDNKKKQKNNTSGVTGVSWHKKHKKYHAVIKHNGKPILLGHFNKPDKDKAIAVRIAAETDPRFKDQEFRHSHNDEHAPSPEMLVWAKQYLEDRIERLNWKEKYNLQ
jgi:hypothetical protein